MQSTPITGPSQIQRPPIANNIVQTSTITGPLASNGTNTFTTDAHLAHMSSINGTYTRALAQQLNTPAIENTAYDSWVFLNLIHSQLWDQQQQQIREWNWWFCHINSQQQTAKTKASYTKKIHLTRRHRCQQIGTFSNLSIPYPKMKTTKRRQQ